MINLPVNCKTLIRKKLAVLMIIELNSININIDILISIR
jgi:hypothetical protein